MALPTFDRSLFNTQRSSGAATSVNTLQKTFTDWMGKRLEAIDPRNFDLPPGNKLKHIGLYAAEGAVFIATLSLYSAASLSTYIFIAKFALSLGIAPAILLFSPLSLFVATPICAGLLFLTIEGTFRARLQFKNLHNQIG